MLFCASAVWMTTVLCISAFLLCEGIGHVFAMVWSSFEGTPVVVTTLIEDAIGRCLMRCGKRLIQKNDTRLFDPSETVLLRDRTSIASHVAAQSTYYVSHFHCVVYSLIDTNIDTNIVFAHQNIYTNHNTT